MVKYCLPLKGIKLPVHGLQAPDKYEFQPPSGTWSLKSKR